MNAINLATVLELPVQERIRIVEAIWDSVANEAARVELEARQVEELDRRVAEFHADPEEGMSWAEVKRRIIGTP